MNNGLREGWVFGDGFRECNLSFRKSLIRKKWTSPNASRFFTITLYAERHENDF